MRIGRKFVILCPYMKLMNRLLGLVAALFMGCGVASSQTDEVVKELNRRGFWFPYVMWLQSDDKMNGYINNLGDNSVEKLKSTLEALNDDHERAQALLKARDEIGGKKKGKKQDERLAKHFKDLDAAKRAFEAAEQAEVRYKRLTSIIRHEIDSRQPVVMPAGKLQYFSYSVSNGFSGYSEEITLDGRKGKHELKVEVQRRRWSGPEDEEEKAIVPKEVGDSVFQRVRDIVEQGKLYETGRYYMPDIEIMDASNWSLDIKFEQGTISSHGYAEGPDHHEALNAITKYLTELFNGEKEKE